MKNTLHYISIFLLGEDLHRLRPVSKRVTNLFLAVLFPKKKNRDAIKIKMDNLSFKLNKDKIISFVKNYPEVKNESETIKLIVENSCSIARFGDGEFNLCIGRGIGFQKYEKTLSSRLQRILKSKDKNILVAINTLPSAEKLSPIWKKFIIRRGQRVSRLFEKNRIYESSTITTTFPSNEKNLKNRLIELKKIWENRKVIFVVGENSRFFLSRDLFDNIKSFEFIYGPTKNAFSKYDSILENITLHSTEKLVLISLGPTATLLSYDLAKLGYQAIDLGHMPSKYHRERYGSLYPKDFDNQKSKRILY